MLGDCTYVPRNEHVVLSKAGHTTKLTYHTYSVSVSATARRVGTGILASKQGHGDDARWSVLVVVWRALPFFCRNARSVDGNEKTW